MKLTYPKRVIQHISETESYKIFSSKIPHNWVIRDLSERDYGIDLYVEIVGETNELKGDIVLIQLKSTKNIKWTKKETHTFSKIKPSTAKYFYSLNIPVFIFLVDLSTKELFYLAVGYSLRGDFKTFAKHEKFKFIFSKKDKFEEGLGVFRFKFMYYYEYYRQQYENELFFFLTNLENYKDFQFEHSNRDYHLGIEDSDLIFFEAMHRNYNFLCTYLDIENPIPKLNDIKIKSQSRFNNNFYELYELDLSEHMETFEKLTTELTEKIKSFTNREISYWLITNRTLYNYVINL